jgi:serine/threonine-protein kinase
LKFCLNIKHKSTLEREINVYNRLSLEHPHSNIVSQIMTAFSADPPFLVYEYIDGGDLISWLASFNGKPVPTNEVLRVMLMCARGLSHAHKHGIVHRDIKPNNILVSRKGSVKITDFGIGSIARETETPTGNSSAFFQTTTKLLGAYTPLYRDPWWPVGNKVDPRVDIYALGMVGYQLLMADFTVAVRPDWHFELEQVKVPEPVIELIGRCVAHPSRRFKDAEELLSCLEDLQLNGYFEKQKKKSQSTPIAKQKTQSKPSSEEKATRPQRTEDQTERKVVDLKEHKQDPIPKPITQSEKTSGKKSRTVPIIIAVIIAMLIWIFAFAI